MRRSQHLAINRPGESASRAVAWGRACRCAGGAALVAAVAIAATAFITAFMSSQVLAQLRLHRQPPLHSVQWASPSL